jgi:hypothetical protein
MRRKISFAVAAVAVAAVALTNPVVADAARRIGSGDIRNDSVRSKDVHNNTLRSKDIHDGSIKAKDLRIGAGSVSAYARVIATGVVPTLDAGRTKNVVSVTRLSTGVYCLELAAGVNRTVAVVAAPEGALGNASAQWTSDCGTNGIQVQTERLSVGGGGNLNSTVENSVSFHVLVP